MNFLKRVHPFEIALIATILCIHIYAAFSDAYNLPNTWFARDDAYYYFKVAQNISEGHGSTFDGINATNGYHPLWMIICVPVFALARFNLILPLRVLLLVMAAFDAATAVLIYRLIRLNLSHAVALLAACFWAFNSYIHYMIYEFGLESPLAAFAVVLFIYKLSQFEHTWRAQPPTRRAITSLAGLAVLLTFSRLDLIFLAVLGGIWIVFRRQRLRLLLPVDLVIIFASLTSAVAFRAGLAEYNMQLATAAIRACAIAMPITVALLYVLGGYRNARAAGVRKVFGATLAATTISAILLIGIASLGPWAGVPRAGLILNWITSSALLLLVRIMSRAFSEAPRNPALANLRPLNELQSNWRTWLTDALPYYGILFGALGAYMLFNKILFGTFSPVSGQIKRWWGTLGLTVYENAAPNWSSFYGISFHGVYDAWPPASNLFEWIAVRIKPLYPGSNTLDERYFISMAACAITAAALLLLQHRHTIVKFSRMAALPLFCGALIQMLSYTSTGYGGTKSWYWISQMILIVVVASVLLDGILAPVQRFGASRRPLQIAALLLGAWMAYGLAAQVVLSMRYNYFPADRPFIEVLPFLEENTPQHAIIGMTGGGTVAYFIHDRTIVNMDGLINSADYFHALQQGMAAQFLHDRGMQIVFANPRLLTLPPYFGQFAPWLQNYNIYGGKNLMYLLDSPKQ